MPIALYIMGAITTVSVFLPVKRRTEDSRRHDVRLPEGARQ